MLIQVVSGICNIISKGFSWMDCYSGALSVVFSIIAVVVAIFVPLKIANNQNKISLFEERREVYEILEFITGFCHSLEKTKLYIKYRDNYRGLSGYIYSVWAICLRAKYPEAWKLRFESSPAEEKFDFLGDQKEMELTSTILLKAHMDALNKAKYVFDEEMEKKIRKIVEQYYYIIDDIILYLFSGYRKDSLNIDEFISMTQAFEENEMNKILELLKLYI